MCPPATFTAQEESRNYFGNIKSHVSLFPDNRELLRVLTVSASVQPAWCPWSSTTNSSSSGSSLTQEQVRLMSHDYTTTDSRHWDQGRQSLISVNLRVIWARSCCDMLSRVIFWCCVLHSSGHTIIVLKEEENKTSEPQDCCHQSSLRWSHIKNLLLSWETAGKHQHYQQSQHHQEHLQHHQDTSSSG